MGWSLFLPLPFILSVKIIKRQVPCTKVIISPSSLSFLHSPFIFFSTVVVHIPLHPLPRIVFLPLLPRPLPPSLSLFVFLRIGWPSIRYRNSPFTAYLSRYYSAPPPSTPNLPVTIFLGFTVVVLSSKNHQPPKLKFLYSDSPFPLLSVFRLPPPPPLDPCRRSSFSHEIYPTPIF